MTTGEESTAEPATRTIRRLTVQLELTMAIADTWMERYEELGNRYISLDRAHRFLSSQLEERTLERDQARMAFRNIERELVKTRTGPRVKAQGPDPIELDGDRRAYLNKQGHFVISEHGCWIPGIYKDLETAKAAFEFDSTVLARLQDDVNSRHDDPDKRFITMGDLNRAAFILAMDKSPETTS